VIVGLTLICRNSYRAVVEFLRDLLGLSVSVGCVHDVLQAATRQANTIDQGQDLSGIRVGLHDEIFQGTTGFEPRPGHSGEATMRGEQLQSLSMSSSPNSFTMTAYILLCYPANMQFRSVVLPVPR